MVEYESEGIDITIRAMMTGLSEQYALARWLSFEGVPPEVCVTDHACGTRARRSVLTWQDPVGAWFVAGMRRDTGGLVAR